LAEIRGYITLMSCERTGDSVVRVWRTQQALRPTSVFNPETKTYLNQVVNNRRLLSVAPGSPDKKIIHEVVEGHDQKDYDKKQYQEVVFNTNQPHPNGSRH
jgi:hypothetical protein